jgi:hypothetical protein
VAPRKRYNAVYTGTAFDLLHDRSSLIPAPDQCLSIFFIAVQEGRATEHNPEGIQANPSTSRKRRSKATREELLRTRGNRLTRSRGMAAIDRRIGAPATPG